MTRTSRTPLTVRHGAFVVHVAEVSLLSEVLRQLSSVGCSGAESPPTNVATAALPEAVMSYITTPFGLVRRNIRIWALPKLTMLRQT